MLIQMDTGLRDAMWFLTVIKNEVGTCLQLCYNHIVSVTIQNQKKVLDSFKPFNNELLRDENIMFYTT